METIAFESVSQIASFAGLTAVTLTLVQLVKASLPARFIPMFAAVVGIALGTFLALYIDTDVVLGIFNGLFAGVAATGAYENLKRPLE